MAYTVTTHRGRGPITFGTFDATNGKAAHGYLTGQKLVTCNASQLVIGEEVETKDIMHRCLEADMVKDKKVRVKKLTVELTLNEFSIREFAQAFWGAAADVTASTVTGEAFATLAAGDIFHTKHGGVSSLILTDSAGSPATLVSGTHYTLDSAAHGRGTIVSVSGLTQPIKAAYSYANYSTILPLANSSNRRGLIYDGINTDNSSSSERIWLPKVHWEPASYDWLADDDEPLVIKGEALYLSELSTDAGWGPFSRIDALPST